MARRGSRKPIEKRLGERVAALRSSQGQSQADLARRAGVSQSSVARLEAGERSVTVGTLESIALGLGVEAGELLSKVAEKPKLPKSEKAYFRVCAKLRGRDERELRAVERLVQAPDAVTR